MYKTVEACLKKKTGLKTALILSNLDAQVEVSLFVPLLASILMTYPDAGNWLNLSMTVCSGVMVPTILIVGKLADYFDKKKMMMLGTFIFMLGGLSAMFSWNIYSLVCFRILEGIGAGIAYPMAPAITAAVFHGDEKAHVIGLSNAGASLIAFVFNLSAGVIALFHWKLAFLIYLTFIPVLWVQLAYIPNFLPERQAFQTTANKHAREKIPYLVYLVVLFMIAFASTAWLFNLKLAIFVTTELGGNSFTSGLANAAQPIAAFLIGLAFAPMYKRIRHYTPAISLLAAACSYLLLAVASSAGFAIFAMLFIGISSGLMIPYLINLMSEVSPRSRMSMSMSWVTMGMLLGSFLSSFTVLIFDYFSGGSIRGTFYELSGLFLLCALIITVTVFYRFRIYKK